MSSRPSTSSRLERPVSSTSFRLSLSQSTSTGQHEAPTPPRTPSPPPRVTNQEDRTIGSHGTTRSVVHRKPSFLPSIKIGDDEDHDDNQDFVAAEGEGTLEQSLDLTTSRRRRSKDGIRPMRSIERTRSWAEEVERNRRRHEKRRDQEKDRQAALSAKEGPYGQAFWSVSTEVIDSLVEALNPSSSDLSHLPSAASVISANQRRSYRMDSDSSSASESEQEVPTRLSSHKSDRARDRGGGRVSSTQLEVMPPSPRIRKRSYASRRSNKERDYGSPTGLSAVSLPPASPISPLDPIPPLRGSPLRSSFGESNIPQAPHIADSPGVHEMCPLSPVSVKSTKSVMSIDDIIARHSPGALKAVDDAKERARKEIVQDNLRSSNVKAKASNISTPVPSPSTTNRPERLYNLSVDDGGKSQIVHRRERDCASIVVESDKPITHTVTPKRSSLPTRMIPPISSGTTSLPPPRPHTLPIQGVPQASRSFHDQLPKKATTATRTADDRHSLSEESLSQEVKIGQALLDQLKQESARSSTPSSSKRISFQSPRRGTLASRASTPTKSSKLTKRSSMPGSSMTQAHITAETVAQAEQEAEAHSHAVYLRSKHLNRVVTLSQPYAQRELNVSLAEVGKPTGQPVVIFLGLGCVRYLIALFDDIARAFNLRLICIDRWGLGKTDQVAPGDRTVMAWAFVVERVLDEIGVKDFQVLAHSAGAPYALACALRMGQRVRGKMHLLAPWVSADIDGGYKWLKWIPNGVIKGATAAEWKLQSYLLGKPPPLSYKPISHNARAPISSFYAAAASTPTTPLSEADDDDPTMASQRRKRQDSMATRTSSPSKPGGLVRRASRILAPRSVDHLFTSMPPLSPDKGGIASRPRSYVSPKPHREGTVPAPKLGNTDTRSTDQLRPRSRPDSLYLRPSQVNEPSSFTPPSRVSESFPPRGSKSQAETRDDLTEIDPELDLDGMGYLLSEGFDFGDPSMTSGSISRHPACVSPSGSSRTKSDLAVSSHSLRGAIDSPPPAPAGPGFTMALTQASHAECEPGTTSDLFSIVLNREPRPWGFEYPDIKNSIKIWYGEEDDKISEKSMRWMERSMVDVELIVRKGEGHSMMTSRGTMWEVFESLGKEAKGFARAKEV